MPVIKNSYTVDSSNYAYAPSDIDYNGKCQLSNKELSSLIDSLCDARSENPDVTLMDQVRNNRQLLNPILQEQMEIEQDRVDIETDILKSIFESETELSIEERNELIANGLYQKYQNTIAAKQKKEDKEAMDSIEAELRASLERNPAEPIEQVSTPVTERDLEPVTDPNGERFQTASETNVFDGATEADIKTEDTAVATEAATEVPVADDNATETMSIEEFNDVPVSDLKVSDDKIINKIMSGEGDYSIEEAKQMLQVMNRYRNREDFSVYDALPYKFKNELDQKAAEMGADPATMEFYAKSFINNLINETYIETEINDFNQELSKTLEPMNNVVGTMMDEYNDEVYNNFTSNILEKAKEFEEAGNEEKAAQLRSVDKSFTEAVKLSRIIAVVDEFPSIINKHYKYGRDSNIDMQRVYNKAIKELAPGLPAPKSLVDCYHGLRALEVPHDYALTILSLVKEQVINAVNAKTLEEHIYAYYLTNSLVHLKISATKGKMFADTSLAVMDLVKKIDDYMKPLKERNSKKDRKRRNKKK